MHGIIVHFKMTFLRKYFSAIIAWTQNPIITITNAFIRGLYKYVPKSLIFSCSTNFSSQYLSGCNGFFIVNNFRDQSWKTPLATVCGTNAKCKPWEIRHGVAKF
ncbi:unnamed protein product [Trichogramma brassicae]|uniref:Uncharacterized protein n=1 Tax=Trichogramma brassicae TaxID=86971 RepID=A0A6H5IFK1_9HYME|nr:unnamed protein product [Trichogramma brassicae]